MPLLIADCFTGRYICDLPAVYAVVPYEFWGNNLHQNGKRSFKFCSIVWTDLGPAEVILKLER